MRLIWIPNILSLSNLFFGFTSMLAALRGRFDLAAVFIFCSMILDMMDGRVARMIKHENPLGKDLDSFADLISFGIAPGVIFYAAFLGRVPVYPEAFGLLVEENLVHLAIGSLAFIFPLCAALRLARFNVSEDTGVFSGLPSPVAGGTIVFLTAFDVVPGLFIEGGFLAPLNFALPYPVLIAFFVLFALLMVSKITFKKPTKYLFNIKGFSSLGAGIVFNVIATAMMVLFFKFFLLIVVLIYFVATFYENLKPQSA